jgi:hypothetical protein
MVLLVFSTVAPLSQADFRFSCVVYGFQFCLVHRVLAHRLLRHSRFYCISRCDCQLSWFFSSCRALLSRSTDSDRIGRYRLMYVAHGTSTPSLILSGLFYLSAHCSVTCASQHAVTPACIRSQVPAVCRLGIKSSSMVALYL